MARYASSVSPYTIMVCMATASPTVKPLDSSSALSTTAATSGSVSACANEVCRAGASRWVQAGVHATSVCAGA